MVRRKLNGVIRETLVLLLMVNNTIACKFSKGDYNSCKDYDCKTGMCKLFSTVVHVTDDIHVSYSHKWISYQWDFLCAMYCSWYLAIISLCFLSGESIQMSIKMSDNVWYCDSPKSEYVFKIHHFLKIQYFIAYSTQLISTHLNWIIGIDSNTHCMYIGNI